MTRKVLLSTGIITILGFISCTVPLVNAQLVERPLITARHAVVTSDEPPTRRPVSASAEPIPAKWAMQWAGDT